MSTEGLPGILLQEAENLAPLVHTRKVVQSKVGLHTLRHPVSKTRADLLAIRWFGKQRLQKVSSRASLSTEPWLCV